MELMPAGTCQPGVEMAVDKCSSLLPVRWIILEGILYISQRSTCNGATFVQQLYFF